MARSLRVTPLPDTAGFPITLDIKALAGHARTVRQIETINAQDAPTGTHPFEQNAQAVRFQTHGSDFAYRVHFE